MKPLLPTLKEKKRYVVFEVLSESEILRDDVADALYSHLHDFLGTFGLAKAGVEFVSKRWNKAKKRGILRISHKSVDLVKSSFLFINTIKKKKVAVRSLGTSALIEKAQKKYIAK